MKSNRAMPAKVRQAVVRGESKKLAEFGRRGGNASAERRAEDAEVIRYFRDKYSEAEYEFLTLATNAHVVPFDPE
jgi:hypothetical protein